MNRQKHLILKSLLPTFVSIAFCIPLSGNDGNWKRNLDWSTAIYGVAGTNNSLPFWSVTNKNGIFPDASGGTATAGMRFSISEKNGWSFSAGTILSGTAIPASLRNITASPVIPAYKSLNINSKPRNSLNGSIDELYAAARWKAIELDLGIIIRDSEYDGLSLTGGNILWSGNAKTLPGYYIHTDYFDVPFTKGILSFKASYGDFMFLDKRYTSGARLHNKSLALKVNISQNISLSAEFEHFALWSGTNPESGIQPHSFKDYMRVCLGKKGGDDAILGDQINVLGDHKGRESFKVEWKTDEFHASLAHDIPFEDGSGMRFQNFPDGVNTLFFAFNDKNRWVSEAVYEFVYTKWQSGPRHDRPATEDELEKNPDKPVIILGGCDNYFNNFVYKSGWTYYGRTIGLPLLTPMPVTEDGMVKGISNNRVTAHHVGIGGSIAHKIPYRLKMTYSRNFGNYSQRIKEFDKHPRQFSFAFETDFSKLLNTRHLLPGIAAGFYFDVGELYENNFGITLSIALSGNCGW